jgi:hypothetical protein
MKSVVTVLCLMGFAVVLGCAKSPAPEPAVTPEAAPVAPAEPAVQAPAAQNSPSADRATQAASMAAYLRADPGCDRFRTLLEEAGRAPAGSVDPDITDIMAQAKEAGCF